LSFIGVMESISHFFGYISQYQFLHYGTLNSHSNTEFLQCALDVLNNGKDSMNTFSTIEECPANQGQALRKLSQLLGFGDTKDNSGAGWSKFTEQRFTSIDKKTIMRIVAPAIESKPFYQNQTSVASAKRRGIIMADNFGKKRRTGGPKGRPHSDLSTVAAYKHFVGVNHEFGLVCVNCKNVGNTRTEKLACDNCNEVRLCTACEKSVAGRKVAETHYRRCPA